MTTIEIEELSISLIEELEDDLRIASKPVVKYPWFVIEPDNTDWDDDDDDLD
jgi:hypothetical protein